MPKPNTPCRRVLLCGAYGADNLGDETLLKVIVSELKRLEPDLDICVITRKPEETASLYGVSAVHTFNFAEIRRRMRRADMFINGGGSLIQNVTSRRSLYYYLALLRLAKDCGCAVMLYGCGIGPLSHSADRKRAARVLNSCVDAITLRDKKSAELLAELGVTRPEIKLAADPVVSLYGCDEKTADAFFVENGLAPDGAYALFALRPWADCESSSDAISGAVKYAYSKLGLTPVFMTLNPSLDTPLAEKTAKAAGVPFVILPPVNDAELAIGVMKKMRLVVSMRLHALLFAASAGTAAVGISYDPKVSGFVEYTGCGACVELSELDSQRLIECMRLELGKSDAAERKKRMEKIKAAERENSETVKRYIRGKDV